MNPKPTPCFIIREPIMNESYRLLYVTRTAPNLRLSIDMGTCSKLWPDQIKPRPARKFYRQERLGLNSYFSLPISTLASTYHLHTSPEYLPGKNVLGPE
jgi:hypothetical protein